MSRTTAGKLTAGFTLAFFIWFVTNSPERNILAMMLCTVVMFSLMGISTWLLFGGRETSDG